MGDYDVRRRQCSMYDVILVQSSDAFNDRKESIANFLLIEMHDVVATLAILDLILQGGFLFSVQQAIIVSNRSE